MSPGSSGNTFGFSSISSSSFSFIHLHHSCLLLSCVSAWGLNPLPKWTHTHTRLTQTLLSTHRDPACYSCLYGTHEKDAHEDFLSQQKNGGQNKNVILTKTRRKEQALRFWGEKKVFFGCQNNRMNKSRGLTSFRPSSWLQRVCSGLPFSWQQARLLLYSSFCSFLFFVFMDGREVLRWWSLFGFEIKSHPIYKTNSRFSLGARKLFFSKWHDRSAIDKRCQLSRDAHLSKLRRCFRSSADEIKIFRFWHVIIRDKRNWTGSETCEFDLNLPCFGSAYLWRYGLIYIFSSFYVGH